MFYRNEKGLNQNFFKINFKYNGLLKALWLSRKFNPLVYHVFSSWNFDIAYGLIKKKIGKVIFDDYDVMAGMVFKDFAAEHYPGQIKKEKYCLEHANGICCRSLETQYAKRKLKYNIRCPRIFFPEYVWGRYSELKKDVSKMNTLVFAGSVNNKIKMVAFDWRK